jgi:hypothetical protein
MSGYIFPVGDIAVSCDFDCHKARRPPSIDPGTDYACAYGTPVRNIAAGRVILTDDDPGGAAGKQIGVQLDNGMYVRYLHMSTVLVRFGQRIPQGHVVGRSGASGFGKLWHYGPHLHLSLGTSLWGGNVDFEKYMAGGGSSGGGGGDKPAPAPKPKRRGREVITFWTIATDGKAIWALAGASPGVAGANWVETREQETGNSFAAQTGGSTELTVKQWDSLKRNFQGPVRTVAG